jgi:biopolymer transport protein TolR
VAGSVGGKGANADINVAPLVDVVLVLLIIFMVITPLLAKNIPIEVPQKTEMEEPPDDKLKEQVVLKLFSDGHVEVNKQTVALDDVEKVIEETYKNRKDKVMFFEGEDDAVYGLAVQLMDAAKGAGVDTVGIMTPRRDEDGNIIEAPEFADPGDGAPAEPAAPTE